MLGILFEIFVCSLAVYGTLTIIFSIVDSIARRVKRENPGIKAVLLVKDQEDTVEGVVRNILTGDFIRKVMAKDKLIIVDMGSKDKTYEILEKLKKDYDSFELLEEAEKEKIFTYS